MWYQFSLQNMHFGVSMFSALALFTVFWLYLDSYLADRRFATITKAIGFFILSLSFVAHATTIESSILTSSIFNGVIETHVLPYLKLAGYLTIILGLLMDPIEPKPNV